MADTKISGMSAAAALTGSEVLPVVQSAANVKATTQQVVDAAMTTGLTRQALGSINTNTTIDWSLGSYVTATIAGALTFTFSNPAASGKACVAYLQLTNGGSAVITWPVSVTWAGATAPTLRTSGTDLLRFYTQDGGTNWFGELAQDEAVTPGGSTTQLQYNNAGAFAGMSGTAWDDTNRSLAITGATVTTSKPILDLSQTWNNAGVTFTGWKLNITDTASATASKLIDEQVGGSSKFVIRKDGEVWFGLDGGSIGNTGIYAPSFYQLGFRTRGQPAMFLADGDLGLGSATTGSASIGFGATNGTSRDAILYRDAANTIAQRNGTNAQTFRVYRSYTDASNYSRWTVKWNTSTAILHAEGAGTGTDGSVAFNDAALATNATVGFLMIPSCAGTPTGTPADIPTGQAPIVYDSTNKKLAVWDGAAWVQTAALT